ncbi:MAG TPA: cytochrome ubiquinol oxidase subunit I, partial [Telluria sp.]
VLVALACLVAAFACDFNGQRLAGLDPTATAWGATVAAMLAYQGLHVAILALAALYLCARAWCGHVTSSSRATLDNIALMWHYTTLQGIAAAVAIHAVPWLMG